MKKDIFLILAFILTFGACTPQDAVYKDLYLAAAGKIYPQLATNLSAEGGYLNAKLSWDAPISPVCKEAVVYWNNQKDSIRFNLNDPAYNEDRRICVTISDLQEKDYTFDVYIIDKEGHRSFKKQVLTTVIGPRYVDALGCRIVISALVNEISGVTEVTWSENPRQSIYSELKYTSKDGSEVVVKVDTTGETTIIRDLDLQGSKNLEYRSAFVLDRFPETIFCSWNKVEAIVDDDYAEVLDEGVEVLHFTANKSIAVTEDPENPNITQFRCTAAEPRIYTKPMNVPVQGPVLVFQYKQTIQSTKLRIYWIDKDGAPATNRIDDFDISSYAYGTDDWHVAKIDLSSYFEKRKWAGNPGDYARVHITTTAGNIITVRNPHFRQKRAGE